MAQLFETLCMMLAFKESHSLAVHYCRLVWDVRSLSYLVVSVKSSGVGVFIANKKASQGWLSTKMTICSFAGFHRSREGWCPEALDEF